MTAFLAKRLLLAVPVLFIVTLMIFVLIHIIPGDPGRSILGPEATPHDVAVFDRLHGLDRPLVVQYVSWVGGALHGDLGTSLAYSVPVITLIEERMPATAELAIGALVVATIVAIPAGILAAARRASALDYVSTFLALSGLSIPQFWLGILLIMFFAVKLHWLPASGYVPIWQNFGANIAAMIMPIIVTGLRESAVTMRLMRSSLLDVLDQDYMRTASAKGLMHWVVVVKHGVRNALMPVLTVSGLQLGGLLGGLVITETIFVIPGFGQLIVQAILDKDYITLQGAVLISATLVIVVNLVVDILYAVLNPRIRITGGTRG